MSAEQVQVHVLVVSRQGRSDVTGPAVAKALQAEGHEVAERLLVPADPGQLREAVRLLAASDAPALVLVGGTTLFEESVTQQALAPLMPVRFEGFASLARHVAFEAVGSDAMWLEAFGGLVGRTAVFALPPSESVAPLLVERLIGPQLAAASGLAQVQGGPPPGAADEVGAYAEVRVPDAHGLSDVDEEPDVLALDPDTQEAVFEEVPAEDVATDEEAEALPEPSGTLGHLGRRGLSFGLTAQPDAERPADEHEGQLPGSGWVRAVHEIRGTVHYDKREELPQPVEAFAPLIDVLHQAGETAVLSLPSGVRYSLWGYPDLRRPSSKVLALGWGKPLCELLALHRYPIQTGTCVEGAHGQLPMAGDNIAAIAEAVTGREPPEPGGSLFAIEGDAVYILRDNQVYRWDGRREQQHGNIKQALASLVLAWSQR
jgi:molybdenum cofactor biosynthesis protein B